MSDNNQTQDAGASNPAPANPPAAAPAAVEPQGQAAAPAATPAAPQPKTFTQRFQEIERATYQLQYVLQFHSQLLQNMIKDIGDTKETIKALREVTTANMRLAEEGKEGTSANIASKVTELQAEAYKAVVDGDVANGKIRAIEVAKDNRDLVVFQSTDVLYGYQLLEAFKDEAVRKDLMGKKVGDKVGDMTILGLYEEVLVDQPTPGDSNATSPQDPAQQPQ